MFQGLEGLEVVKAKRDVVVYSFCDIFFGLDMREGLDCVALYKDRLQYGVLDERRVLDSVEELLRRLKANSAWFVVF